MGHVEVTDVVWLEESHFSHHHAAGGQYPGHLSDRNVRIPHMLQNGIRGHEWKGAVVEGKSVNIGKIRCGGLEPIDADPGEARPLDRASNIATSTAAHLERERPDVSGGGNDLIQHPHRRTSQRLTRGGLALLAKGPKGIDRIDDEPGGLDKTSPGTEIDLSGVGHRIFLMARVAFHRGSYASQPGVALGAAKEFGEAHRVERRSEEHTSELQSLRHLVCRLLLEK